ncbi:MAG: hypothetical protein IGS49_29110 [Chlorogloeopsis fritschii C42_A2020_084]|uniref:DUF6887 family protein n=1 Tax=Chlorogloeopsis fritschii TaxID=1124 RepID=UPI001A091203|nr:hypothetical protein [Chlorogloeopsis fritschii]MBF2009379.1 hypothetical protein [Chlorogloeopsis fritschii C42_A2020_084]
MTQPNFDHMTRHELLAYVRSHPEDTEAFHKYMDLLQNASGRIPVTTDEELEAEMRKRISQQQSQS